MVGKKSIHYNPVIIKFRVKNGFAGEYAYLWQCAIKCMYIYTVFLEDSGALDQLGASNPTVNQKSSSCGHTSLFCIKCVFYFTNCK